MSDGPRRDGPESSAETWASRGDSMCEGTWIHACVCGGGVMPTGEQAVGQMKHP